MSSNIKKGSKTKYLIELMVCLRSNIAPNSKIMKTKTIQTT